MSKPQMHKISIPSFNVGLVDKLHALRPDIPYATIASLIIDEVGYYRDHKDVQKAGVPAARHYFQYGEKEKRRYHYPRIGYSKRSATAKVDTGKTVFHTTAPEDNPSWLYRCIFPHKDLSSDLRDDFIFLCGNTVLSETLQGVFASKKIIFLRPTYSPLTIYLIQLCRRIGIEVQLDFDDLLLPEFARERGACRSELRLPKEDFNESLKQSALLLGADKISCSTKSISEILRSLKAEVLTVNNKLPLSYFKSVDNVITRAKSKDFSSDKIRLLYLSGSNTHKRDFSTIMGPLMKLAQNHSTKFSITFMGSLADYSGIFGALGVSSYMIPTVNFEKMLDIIPQHDLVLVPLEKSTFNNCKSNIKYIESASQGVPIIATDVTEFASAIDNGKNGWLCNSEGDWYNQLESIILGPEQTIACGINAYKHAREKFSV
jgi:glycosyltransferase involved in cell wall biosynthesis